MKRTLTAFFIASFASIAQAGEFASPSEVCKYMSSEGMPTAQWKEFENGLIAECFSTYLNLGSARVGMANNLAYYVDGEPGVVSEVKLVLNINQPSGSDHAKESLLRSGQKLSQSVTDAPLPDVIVDSIRQGKSVISESKGWKFELARYDWPSGRGYEMHLIIR